MNRRAFLVAFAIATVGTVMLVLYMRHFEEDTSGGEPIELLTILRPVARGAAITEEMLATRRVPLAYVENRAIRARERAKVIGLRTSTALSAQQTLMWTDLTVTTEDRDLSSLVQPGKRAITIRAGAGDETAGNILIRPGDYVDVLTTTEPRGEERDSGKRSIVLLQKVLVLAVGLATRGAAKADSDSSRSGDKLLTLSLSLQDAQLLGLALDKGRVNVALRNPNDQQVLESAPELKAAALYDVQSRDTQAKPALAGRSDKPVRIEGVFR
jgi:pilus assembly protein CpaB